VHRCELCDKETKVLFKQVYSNDEHLNVCSDCISEGEAHADAEYERHKEEWFNDPDKERN
jgi:ribosome-binding protein aMBF1 (putative translation factor)